MNPKLQTRSQQMAQAAYEAVRRHKALIKASSEFANYRSLALSFPALIHNCGLAQAFTFALAKKQTDYAQHLCSVLQSAGLRDVGMPDAFAEQLRQSEVLDYVRLSRNALRAATWLKRYAEAFSEKDTLAIEEDAG